MEYLSALPSWDDAFYFNKWIFIVLYDVFNKDPTKHV